MVTANDRAKGCQDSASYSLGFNGTLERRLLHLVKIVSIVDYPRNFAPCVDRQQGFTSLFLLELSVRVVIQLEPVFCMVGPHQLTVGIEQDPDLIVALGDPDGEGRSLKSGPDV